MLKYVNPLDQIAVSRLLEFLSDKKPWHRSLWGVSVVLAMEELWEACVALREGYLSEAAVRRMASALQKRMGKHPAFSDEEKHFLRQQLRQVPRAEGAAHFGIRELSCRVTTDYLKRWGQAVAAGTFSIEHFARSVASYLLDQGFSGKYLHSFIKARLDAPEPISLTELCDALHAEMLESPRREFKVLLAFTSLPALPNGIPSSWLRGQAVTAWLKDRNFDTTGVRAAAGAVLNVQARDVIGAAQAARNESDRYASRALIATGKPLNRIPMLWVEGSAAPSFMTETPRGVSVKELLREDRVFSTNMICTLALKVDASGTWGCWMLFPLDPERSLCGSWATGCCGSLWRALHSDP